MEEYYLYDPHSGYLAGWQRRNGRLEEVPEMIGHTSPLLGIHFTTEIRILHRDGRPFFDMAELRAAQKAAERATEAAEARARALADRLRALGIDPDAV